VIFFSHHLRHRNWQLFLLLPSFFVMGAVSEVGVMGKDWLAGEVRDVEELLILLMCSSIRLLDSSFHARNSDRIFSNLACCSSFKKNWKDMVIVWIGDCCRKQSTWL
jgi:hypothetical protein